VVALGMVHLSQAAWVPVAVVAPASGVGLLRLARDGRVRGTHRIAAGPAAGEVPAAPGPLDGLGRQHGERATLLQFSSAFCAPCRATRRVLGEVAGLVPGVVHVELDAEQHLDVVRRLGIVRTPTTLVLDARGSEVSRATGAPTRDEVLAALVKAVAGP
jgi:thiol-disulfide isomerase/thioredoxin